MVAPYPVVDRRRARTLAAELEAMAQSLAPGWSAEPGSGDAGRAVLEIAARLAEHVTRRLDETPRRDALAFLDLLDVPPPAARAAEVPVVFTLAEKRTTPVTAPERTQLTAAGDGEELIFETTSALTLTPARLDRLVTVDGRQDRIEEAPQDVLQAIPPSGLPTDFTALTFAAAGSRSLQLTPSIGLEPGQLVRTGGAAYRVKDAAKTGMVELVEPLEAPLAAGGPVTRITRLESFTLRDRQAHAVMIGHAELFDLEGPAIITLALEPPSLAAALLGLDLAIELFALAPPAAGEDALAADADAPDWHELTRLGTDGGLLRLAKTWTGKVEELEVGGQKSRWLRLRLRGPITGEPEPVPRLRKLAIGVESLDLDEPPTEGAIGVTMANSNGNPLPLTTAFLPFGAEPQRFDVFAFAAPEMLTKRGAKAELHFALQDGSFATFAVGGGGPGTIPLAIGGDGKLRGMALDSDGTIAVTLLGKPGQADLAVPLEATSSLRLVAIATLAPDANQPQLVAALDQGGRLWIAGVDAAADADPRLAVDWQLLADADDRDPVREIVLLPGALPLLSARRKSSLWVRAVALGSAQFFGWHELQPAAAAIAPDLGDAGQLVPVQDATSGALARELVLIDQAGALHHIVLDPIGNLVTWQPVGTSLARTDIRPAAARLADDTLLIHAADPDGQLLTIKGGQSASPPPALAGLTLLPGTALHLAAHQSPEAQEQPILLAFAEQPNAKPVVILHHAPFAPEVVPLEAVLPATTGSSARPPFPGTLLQTDQGAEVVLAGAEQTLARRRVSGDAVAVAVFDVVALADSAPVNGEPADLLEVTRLGGAATLVVLQSPIGEAEGLAVFALEPGTLALGASYRRLRPLDDDPTFQGTIVTTDGVQLQLDGNDMLTEPGTLLQLLVEPLPGRIVEVIQVEIDNQKLAIIAGDLEGLSGDLVYRRVTVIGTAGTASSTQLATLLRLSGPEPIGVSSLRLPATVTPGVQTFTTIASTDEVSWVLVQGQWQSPPPATTTALLLPPAAQTWQASAFRHPINNPDLSFEYWNGSSWMRLGDGFSDGTDNLAQSGDIVFTVPPDIASTEIAGHDDYWIRVRLVGGDYGRPVYQATSKTNDDSSITQSITVDTSGLAPPEIRLLIAGFSLDERRPAERLLVENNLSLVDQTQAAASPSATVTLFASAALLTAAASGAPGRALFLGFTRPFDLQPLSFWVEAQERQQAAGTALRAHVLERGGWRPVTIEDETRGLGRSGQLRVFVPHPPRPERLFGEERFWLCLAPDEPGPDEPGADWQPVVAGLYPNAVRALHAETIEQEILGTSRGEPGQRHDLARTPILTESLELRVRELLSAEERQALVEAGGPGSVTRYTERGIVGDWVRWERRHSFIGAAPDARVFTVTAEGQVRFGDNREGRIPPPGRDVVRAISYQRGGGAIGNVRAYAIQAVKSAIESVEAVANPVAASGGVDAGGLDDLLELAPPRLRHAGRALAPADLEALARDFSTDIRRVRYLGAAVPGGPIRLVVAWRNGADRCPVPTRVQREALARHLALAAWGALVPADIAVVGPRYVALEVEVTLRAASGELAAGLQIAAMERLTAFLDPLSGGPDGQGWPFGRPAFTSDLATLLLPLPGLAEIMNIEVAPETLPPDGLICADPERGAIRLEVTVDPGEKAV